MAENQNAELAAGGTAVLGKDDFVKVFEDGAVREVPKHWIGSHLLAEGVKKATKAQIAEHDKDAADREAEIEAEVRRRVEAELAARAGEAALVETEQEAPETPAAPAPVKSTSARR